MRNAQKEYVRNRIQTSLDDKRNAEEQVDRLLGLLSHTGNRLAPANDGLLEVFGDLLIAAVASTHPFRPGCDCLTCRAAFIIRAERARMN